MNQAYKKFDLTGKTAFVTGGGTGLGYHMAKALAQSGAKVMIAARREQVLKEASEQLTEQASGNPVFFTTMDLASHDSITQGAEYAISTLGGIDIFIGNAGIDTFDKIGDIDNQVIDQGFQVNVSANIELVQLFLPHMRKNQWGRVIFSSSISSIRGAASEGLAVYSASKGALNAFTRVAAGEFGHDNITVNSLVLGGYMTEIVQSMISEIEQEQGAEAAKTTLNSLASMTALGRLGNCDEVEGLIQLLASDAGSYITGTDLSIDGGMAAAMRPNLPGV